MSEHFGTWLQRQIDERLQTQRQFAEQSGISVHTLRSWLTGHTVALHGRHVVQLARALGITREELEGRMHHRRQTAA